MILLTYMWTFDTRVAFTIQTLQNKYPEKIFIEVNCDEDIKQLKKRIFTLL